MNALSRFGWFVIGWNGLTILLGALVRATHSGAGCGRSWPTCQGELLPELAGATTIEFVHRGASGVALMLVAILAVAVYRKHPRRHPARRAVTWAGLAIIGEALIGAAIVLYEWVGSDDSVARVVSVPLHLVNTLLLLAALTLTVWFASGGGRLSGKHGRTFLIGGATALVLIFATGAVTALADTLFPVAGLNDSDTAHFLTRLRVLHPVLAVTVVVAALAGARSTRFPALLLARWVLALSIVQLALGALNIWLSAPAAMQLLHLAVADAIWVSYVWLSAQVLSREALRADSSDTGDWQTKPLHR